MHEPQKYRPASLKKRVLLSVLISISSIVIIFSVGSFFEVPPEIDFARFRFGVYLVGFLLMFAAWFLDGLRVFLSARAWNKSIRLQDALSTVLAGYFMSTITPFSTGGSPAQMYVLTRAGMSWGEAGSLVVICGILYQVSLLLLLFLLIFAFHIGFVLQGVLLKLLYSFVIFYAGVMVLLFSFLYRPQILFRLTEWGINFVKRHFRKIRFSEESVREWVHEFFEDFRRGFRILFFQKPQYLVWNIGCYMVQYTLIFSVAYFVLAAMGVKADYLQVLGTQAPLFYVFSFVPSPGASGGVEVSMASVFARFVGAYRVGMFVLLWRAVTFYLPMVIGGVTFFRIVQSAGGYSGENGKLIDKRSENYAQKLPGERNS